MTARIVLAVLLSAVVLSPGLGCGGAQGHAASDAAQCAPGGWPRPTEGLDERCQAVHAGCCYRSDTEACAAAGCAPGSCLTLESFPAQVECQ